MIDLLAAVDVHQLAKALNLVARQHEVATRQVHMLATRRDDLVVMLREAGMSLRQVAELAGISYTRVAQIEREAAERDKRL